MDRFESLENPRRIILKLIPSSAPSSAENLRTAHTRFTEAPSTSPFSSPTRRTRRHGSPKGGEEKQGKPPSRDLRGEKYTSKCAGCDEGGRRCLCRGGSGGGGGGGRGRLFRRWRWKGGQKVRPVRIGPLAWGGAPFRLSFPLSSATPKTILEPSPVVHPRLQPFHGGKIFSL